MHIDTAWLAFSTIEPLCKQILQQLHLPRIEPRAPPEEGSSMAAWPLVVFLIKAVWCDQLQCCHQTHGEIWRVEQGDVGRRVADDEYVCRCVCNRMKNDEDSLHAYDIRLRVLGSPISSFLSYNVISFGHIKGLEPACSSPALRGISNICFLLFFCLL